MAGSLEQAAARTGSDDVFVLHKIGEDQVIHIDGWGKGSEWSGSAALQRRHEPLLADLYTGAVRLRASTPQRIFGPYWTREAAVVAAGDYIVVFGGDGLVGDDDELHLAAADACWSVAEISPAQRLADRLEVATAELEIARLARSSVPSLAVGIATSAARSLSAAWSAVRLYGQFDGLYLGETPWQPRGSDADLAAAIDHVPVPIDGGPQITNDVDHDPSAISPLSIREGVVARCVIGLGRGSGAGVLVLVHGGGKPRGFTDQCLDIGVAIGSAAGTALDNASRELGSHVPVADQPPLPLQATSG